MPAENKTGNVFDLYILRRLFNYVKPYIGQFWLLLTLTIFSSFLGPLLPLLIGRTVDNEIANKDWEGLIEMTIILVSILVVHSIIKYFHTYVAGLLGQNVIRDLRVKLYRHILNFRLGFFDRTPIGRLITRNVSDIEQLNNVFSEGVANILADSLQIIVIVIFMMVMDWKLTLIILSILPLIMISTYVFKEKIKSSFNAVRNAVSNLNTFVQEHITGMNVIQIFGSEEEEYGKFRKINEEHRNANLRSVFYYSIYFPVAEFISALGLALLVFFGALFLTTESETASVIITFTMLISMLFRPIRMIADRFNTLQMGIVSGQRIFQLLDNKDFAPDGAGLDPGTVKGDVDFSDVWFAYKDEEYVLKDINFSVPEGDTIALVGATGAGKTSIINLLNRFYDIQKGEITIDGRNIKDYDIYALRRNIGLVLQDVFLFSGSVRENITLGNPDIPDNKIWEAADMIGARKFIERLPGKLDYNVMERGGTLSVGQRQMISFIRAMLFNPRIIILDEATSSVDTETEEMIQDAIAKMMKGRTSIVIAHRLSTIQNAGKILVLDKGRIIEQGKHEKLLENNGPYSKLYEMQFVNSEPDLEV